MALVETHHFSHALVVVLQTGVEHVDLVLFLSLVLEHDECSGKGDEHGDDAEIQFFPTDVLDIVDGG